MNRAIVALVTIVAWFGITNHCALRVIDAQVGKPVAHCHGGQSSPAQNNGTDQESPCCKTLRATVTVPVKAPQAHADATLLFAYDFVSQILAFDDRQLQSISYFADTGPPGSCTFAELVLQRSILAHAPPVLA